jgi:membrane-bound ClpP family serine protease
MLKNSRTRRVSAIILVVLGAILMLVAPEIWAGLFLLVLGVALELAGIALGHGANKKTP